MTPENLDPASLKDIEVIAEGFDDDEDESPEPKKQKKKGGSATGAALIVILILTLIGVSGFIAYELLREKPEDPVLNYPSRPPQTTTGGLYKKFSESKAIPRNTVAAEMATLDYADPSLPGIDPNEVTLSSVAYRADKQLRDGKTDFSILSPEATKIKPEIISEDGSTDSSESSESENSEERFPEDIKDKRIAVSPKAYPPSGLEPARYLTWLRNQLNRPDHQAVDLEKAYILVSMYFDNTIEPEVYRGYLRTLANELMGLLAPVSSDGETRKLITDPKQQVQIISDFMLYGSELVNGSRVAAGWEVQEFHPNVNNVGTPLREQNLLIHEVLKNGPGQRNKASSTALNLLTLILLQKLEKDNFTYLGEKFFGEGEDVEQGFNINFKIPMYGVRLPGRTILRYTAGGINEFMPERDNQKDVGGSFGAQGWDMSALKGDEPRLAPDKAGYRRNVEFLRNAKHYDRADYVKRFRIPQRDVDNGIYLQTLSNKRMFATLGYELSAREFGIGVEDGELDMTGDHHRAHVDQAMKLLDEWVLDRDDGTIGPKSKPERVRSKAGALNERYRSPPPSPFPRGDTGLRDAYVLYAEMLLRMGGYERIRQSLNENPVVRNSKERVAEIRGQLALNINMIDEATAYLEDALTYGKDNPRVQLLLGEIHYIQHDDTIRVAGDAFGPSDVPLAKAISHFDSAFEQDNELRRLSATERRLLHFHRGKALFKSGRLEDALKDINRLGEITPEFAITPNYLKLKTELSREIAFRDLAYVEGGDHGIKELGKLQYRRAMDMIEDLKDGVIEKYDPSRPDSTPRIEKDYERLALRIAGALDGIKNLHIRQQLVDQLEATFGKRTEGKERGSSRAWTRWLNQHFKANQ